MSRLKELVSKGVRLIVVDDDADTGALDTTTSETADLDPGSPQRLLPVLAHRTDGLRGEVDGGRVAPRLAGSRLQVGQHHVGQVPHRPERAASSIASGEPATRAIPPRASTPGTAHSRASFEISDCSGTSTFLRSIYERRSNSARPCSKG